MADLAHLIDAFLADAPIEQHRELRARLAHVVASPLAVRDAASLGMEDVHTFVTDLESAGVPAHRAGAVVDTLRVVLAHAVAHGTLRSSPLIGFAPVAPDGPSSPTTAVVALGEQAAAWTARLIVIGFLLAAVGLVVALA